MENKQPSREESEPRGSGGSEEAQRLQGHDRLHSRLAGRCSKRRAGTTKGERKTANSPFTLQTQVRVVWKTERDHSAYGVTFLELPQQWACQRTVDAWMFCPPWLCCHASAIAVGGSLSLGRSLTMAGSINGILKVQTCTAENPKTQCGGIVEAHCLAHQQSPVR